MIVNPIDPTPEYARQWMYSESSWPEQDWDLFLANGKCDQVLLDCARDKSCPNSMFALHCLYFLVGDLIHSNLGDKRRNTLLKLLQQVQSDDPNEIVIWKNEAAELIRDKGNFDYEYWCQHSI